MAQHKWHKEIKAWADGAEIEQANIRKNANPHWYECDNPPKWDTTLYQFRIKPQPKEPKYLYVYHTTKGIELGYVPHESINMYNIKLVGKIKLEADDDTSGT